MPEDGQLFIREKQPEPGVRKKRFDKGTLEAGKLADLMILDRDPLETPPMELKDVQTLATIKEGFLLWQKKDEIL